MQTEKGTRLQAVRNQNIKVIYDCLLEKPMSGRDLAEEIGISATSIGKIFKEMLSLNLVQKIPEKQQNNNAGRRHERYIINGKNCYIIGINLTYLNEFYFICDLSGNIIYRHKLHFDYLLSRGDLDSLFDKIEKKISEFFSPTDSEYVFILSVPGQISSDTNVLMASARMDSMLGTNLSQIIYERFGKTSLVKNDVNYIIQGQMLHKTDSYSVFCFVDYGIALSFLQNGNILTGYRGYAGEIGKNIINGQLLKSITTIQFFYEEGKKIKPDLTVEGIVELYNSSLEYKTVILKSAEYLAQALCNFGNIVAYQSISFGGIVTEFGEEYFEVIRKHFLKHSSVPVHVSYYKDVSPEAGMIKSAQELIIDNILRLRIE